MIYIIKLGYEISYKLILKLYILNKLKLFYIFLFFNYFKPNFFKWGLGIGDW